MQFLNTLINILLIRIGLVGAIGITPYALLYYILDTANIKICLATYKIYSYHKLENISFCENKLVDQFHNNRFRAFCSSGERALRLKPAT